MASSVLQLLLLAACLGASAETNRKISSTRRTLKSDNCVHVEGGQQALCQGWSGDVTKDLKVDYGSTPLRATFLQLDAATATRVTDLSRRLNVTELKKFYGVDHQEWLQRMFDSSFRGFTDEERRVVVDGIVDALDAISGHDDDPEATRQAVLRMCVIHKGYNLQDNFIQTLSPVMQRLYQEALGQDVNSADLDALKAFYEEAYQRVLYCL